MDGGSSSGTTRFTLDQRPRLTRASNPKVRTGCITCKRRRKKCDEGNPACAACLKYQGYCPGYTAACKTQPATTAQGSQPIRPKPAAAADRAEGDGPAPRPRYASLVFADQLERDHFDCWRRFTERSLLFPCDLSSRLIPQLSWNDPAVRHAALAIGAAASGCTTREQRILGKGGDRHHLAALSHYGTALRLLCSLPVSPERTLVVCLLFIAFECFRGRTTAALSHINHGLRIIEHCHRHHQHRRGAGPPLVPLLTDIVNSCRGRRARYAVQEMPAVFETLERAHWWWNRVRHHVEHRAPLHSNFQVKRSSSSPGGPVDQPPPRGYGSPESARRVRTFTHHLDAWAAAFAPLAVRAEAGRAADPAEYLKALSLRVHYLYLWTGVRSAGWTDAVETARLTPTFRDIVALGGQLLAAQAAQRRRAPGGGDDEVFTVEDGPIWPAEYPRRDGLLDTRAFLVMMEWIDGAASAGVVTGEQSPVADRVVFDGDAVVLQKQLWDPGASRWRNKNIRFSIL